MADGVHRLLELGQSPWYDNLTRSLARGGLSAMVDGDGIRGVTSNPTIFEKALAEGGEYDAQVAELAAAGADPARAYWELVLRDVADAADLLAPVHAADGGAGDGYVSIEVDPDLAHDTAGTVAQARELFERLGRPNVMIKIPATAAGLPAVTEVIAAGINVNCTLIFGLDRYVDVVDAYLDGLERRHAAGRDLAVASVASFFVSRVDTETDRRLPEGHPARGRTAVANARLAYQQFLARFSGPRWDALAAAGAAVQRPLWASTSTKNPAYSPTLYVDTLVGPRTVNTLAQASVDALRVLDPAALRPDTILDDLAGAQATFAGVAEAGVDLAEVTATLEAEGVAAFASSYHAALATVAERLAAAGA